MVIFDKKEEREMNGELEFEYQHTLEDGREVGLMMLGGHIYGNADITAGYAEGAEPDIMYLRLVRGEDETLLLLRPDELAAVVQAGSCALTAYLVDMAEDLLFDEEEKNELTCGDFVKDDEDDDTQDVGDGQEG